MLPSFSDPNPLSVIEALNAGLPIFVSNQCGNVHEAVQEGQNGFSFNPYDTNEIKQMFGKLIARKEEFQILGNTSLKIAEENFSPVSISHNFFKKISENNN